MTTTRVDRAALVRRAMVEIVAERGLYGASMSLVAERAGVATGTAYVHYQSKDDLLIAAFVEVKRGLAESALRNVDLSAEPHLVFDEAWRNIHTYLAADPQIARFLLQVEASPIHAKAHDALSEDDPLTRAAEVLSAHLVDLPGEILYELGLAPAVRLVASGVALTGAEIARLVEACWRAVAAPELRSS